MSKLASAVLTVLFLTIAGAAPTAADENPPQTPFQKLNIAELAWLAPEADATEFLTKAPVECLLRKSGASQEPLVEIGRSAFRSPLLLGGPAARHGLSCNSCHRNGHDNPTFFLKGLSGAPGTADVTHSLFSKTREDGVLNPVPIPTLLGASEKEKFGTVAPTASLEAFISGAITQEFQGEAPTDIVLAGLVEYVRQLDEKACSAAPGETSEPIDLSSSLDDLKRAMASALWAIDNSEGEGADFMLLSAQRIAGDIHARYAASSLEKERHALFELGRDLARVRAMTAADPAGAKTELRKLSKQVKRFSRTIGAKEKLSLYNPKMIDAALELSE